MHMLNTGPPAKIPLSTLDFPTFVSKELPHIDVTLNGTRPDFSDSNSKGLEDCVVLV